MKKIIAITVAAGLMTGCAGIPLNTEQVSDHIDPISITNRAVYKLDVQECTDLANERTKNAALKAFFAGLASAAAGAAVGGAVGGITHTNPGQYAGVGAVAAGSAGTMNSMMRGMNKKQTIVYRCLMNRGYALLY